MRSERGFTLIELLVAMAAGLVVMLGTFALVDATTRESDRQVMRVDANQRARPVLQRLMDELHSTCVGPNVTPVLAGSGDSALTFLAQTGSAVSPTPDEHVVSLSSGALSESIYPATGGAAPTWTFSATPSSTRQLLTGVGGASIGSGGSIVPLFQYFAYAGAQLSTTPLPTPLSATDAARTAEITVAFSASPSATTVPDPNSAIPVTDSAILRLSPASEDPTKANPPCA